MKYLFYSCGTVLGLIGLVLTYMIWNAYRGGRRAYKKLTAEIGPDIDAILAGNKPDPDRWPLLLARPATCFAIYQVLKEHNKLEIMPPEYLNGESFAKMQLAFWLCHPNELAAPPDEIQIVGMVEIPDEPAETRSYYLLRFRMLPPHWRSKQGWLAGVVGPINPAVIGAPSGQAFSRFEPIDAKSAEEHVNAVHSMLAHHQAKDAFVGRVPAGYKE